MEVLNRLTREVEAGRELGAGDVAVAAAALASAEVADEAKAPFLSALHRKGESARELAHFARAFRERALEPGVGAWSPRAIDVVGTGGDHSGGFNVSSMVTLVVACAGVPVMKHGNRGVTSKCGSADLFSALGVDLEAPAGTYASALESLGYVFFFAPRWHPAFRQIGPVRKLLAARGERTIFNILGPLLNPGRPAHMLLGAASLALAERMADALDELGTHAALAVHGSLGDGRGIDELTTATANAVRGAGRLRGVRTEWPANAFGFTPSPFSDIAGGDVAENLRIAQALASGGGPRGLADTVVLNSAVALWIAGARPEVAAAIPEAREILLGGAVKRKMEATRAFYERTRS